MTKPVKNNIHEGTMTITATQLEEIFLTLEEEDRVNIISQGVVLRLSDLRKRLDTAMMRVQRLEEKYNITLSQLDAAGLPDDADYQFHEDYVMWHHWVDTIKYIKERILALEAIANQGLCMC